jgi:general secretion pathway protein D
MTRQERSFALKLSFVALLAGVGALGTQAADVPEPSQHISEVIPIEFAKASEIAAALSWMTANSVGTNALMGGPSKTSPPGTPLNTNPNATSNAWNILDQSTRDILRAAVASGEFQNMGQSRIISDERTNSLLIHATRQDMRTFKEIISRLDHPLGQLLIEAAIIDISVRDSGDFSTRVSRKNTEGPNNESLGASMLSSSNLFFVTDLRPMVETDSTGGQAIESDHVANPAKNARAPSTAAKPKASQRVGFAYLARVGTDLDAIVLALATDNRVRILQRPRVQTSSGEPACLFVGESRPFSTNDYYGGGAYSSYPVIRQISAGVTLEVTPFAKPDGSVEMGIQQVLDQFSGTVSITNVGDVPITTRGKAQASLTVRDRETLLLGGWVQALKDKTHSGVPLLKHIPLLGALFRSSSARAPRHELIVLIRPTFLPAQRQASSATTRPNSLVEAKP